MSLIDLAQEFLVTLHLNVTERDSLPDGEMPFSALVQAAQRVLAESRFVPPQFGPNHDFTGGLLEMRGDELYLHERHEIGVTRLSPTASRRLNDLPSAVRQFISANGGDNIDGVKISFNR